LDISKYIIENSTLLFGQSYGTPVKIDLEQKIFTSEVIFCKVHFSNDVTKKIVIKHYNDLYPDRLSSLFNEYKFSNTYIDSFNSDDIGIPKYIHFDAEKELVAIDYVENSCTLEKTLLNTHLHFNSKPLSKYFYNSGKWLSFFHSLNSSSENYEISHLILSSEIKTKWIKEFNNQSEIQNDFKFFIEYAVKENLQVNTSLLHKEYAPGNILHVGNKIYGIDFGSTEQGCILDDITFFLISVLVLNKYPNHPFYKRVKVDSLEINHFCKGYLSYSNAPQDIFDAHLFRFFLYKSLIRRISFQLWKANQFPKSLSFITKPFIYSIFYRIRKSILSCSTNKVID
jgi:hypothetical protein